MKKERLVAAIENGTVIDHIPAEKTYQVVSLLGLEHTLSPVTIGYNYPSSRLGRKGIVKISNKFFTDEEINRLSVIAPKIILNIIVIWNKISMKLSWFKQTFTRLLYYNIIRRDIGSLLFYDPYITKKELLLY